MTTLAQKIKTKKPFKFSTRAFRRCEICGRKRWYLKKFGLCRICFRDFASRGQIPGIKKSSW